MPLGDARLDWELVDPCSSAPVLLISEKTAIHEMAERNTKMMNKICRCLFATAMFFLCCTTVARASIVLDFEGITPVITNPGPSTLVRIPDGYGGLNWSGSTEQPYANSNHSAFDDGVVSGDYAAVFGTQTTTVTNPDGTFDFISMWVTGGWFSRTATVFGYLNGVEIYSNTNVVATNGDPTLYTFNWTGIDELVFPIVQDGFNDDYVVDDFTIDNVTSITPEPTTLVIWSLLATLGVGFGWRRRRRA